MFHWRFTTAALAVALALPAAACHPTKKVYTIPTVKDAILTAIQKARKERRKGRLDKASDILLAEGKRVLKEYPTAVLRPKTVKKLWRMSRKIGNLCLDYSQELIQEAVSDKMWKLSNVYKKRYAKHQKLNRKLRELIARLPKTEVTAKQKPAPVMPEVKDETASPAAGAGAGGSGDQGESATKPAGDQAPARPAGGSDEGPITP